MKLAIVGSRDYPDLSHIQDYVNLLDMEVVVVSGGAKGVDEWAVFTANWRGMATKIFPADWNLHGKAAGFIRNKDIVDFSDKVVGFWDGKSRGTMHTWGLAKQQGKAHALYVAKPGSGEWIVERIG